MDNETIVPVETALCTPVYEKPVCVGGLCWVCWHIFAPAKLLSLKVWKIPHPSVKSLTCLINLVQRCGNTFDTSSGHLCSVWHLQCSRLNIYMIQLKSCVVYFIGKTRFSSGPWIWLAEWHSRHVVSLCSVCRDCSGTLSSGYILCKQVATSEWLHLNMHIYLYSKQKQYVKK